MALTEGKGRVTSSYIGSILFALVVSCRSEAALIFALFLLTIAVMETTTLIIKAVARELIEAMYAIALLETNTLLLG